MEDKNLFNTLLKRIDELEERIKQLEDKEKDKTIKEVKPERGAYTKLVIDYINYQIESAKKEGKEYIELTSRDIQKAVGLKNRLPLVCKAMQKCMNKDCIIMHKTPSMQSSTLTIRWDLSNEYNKNKDINDNNKIIKSNPNSEDTIMPYLTLDDFDEETINLVRKLSTINNSSSKWKELNNEDFLKQDLFYKADKETKKEGFTLESFLLFGKKESITQILPAYKIDILLRINDEVRYDARYICEENLIKSYDSILNYLDIYAPNPFFLDEEGRTINVVVNILKELVTNILIHRDYKGRNPARILIYKDKIIVENSNKKKTYENNIIEEVFKFIGYLDGIKSGLNKVRNLCEKYFHNEPLIEDTHIFRVTIYYKNTKVIKSEVKSDEEAIISYIKSNGSITSEISKKILNKEKTYCVKLLNNLIDKKVIFRHGNGRSTYYDFEE